MSTHLHGDVVVGAVQQGDLALHVLQLLGPPERRPGQVAGGRPVGRLVLFVRILREEEARNTTFRFNSELANLCGVPGRSVELPAKPSTIFDGSVSAPRI